MEDTVEPAVAAEGEVGMMGRDMAQQGRTLQHVHLPSSSLQW